MPDKAITVNAWIEIGALDACRQLEPGSQGYALPLPDE